MLKSRRSIRKFKNKAINIDNIIETSLLSPSSKNFQPWEIIVVDDKELLEKLSYCRGKKDLIISECSKAVIVVGDTTKHPDDLWIEDCSVVATTLHYQAHYENLGSCWIQIRNRMHNENISASNFIKDMFDIPTSYEVHSIVAIGVSDQEVEPRKADMSKVHFNKF